MLDTEDKLCSVCKGSGCDPAAPKKKRIKPPCPHCMGSGDEPLSIMDEDQADDLLVELDPQSDPADLGEIADWEDD